MIDLAIIGCGNMGRAFAEGLLRAGVVAADALKLIERRAERRQLLIDELGCNCEPAVTSLEGVRFIMLAVKPQDLKPAADMLLPHLKPGHVVISILAGVSIPILSRAFGGHQRIVRAMPNLPAIIGAGMTAYVCSEAVSGDEADLVRDIFNAVGDSLQLQSEELLNGVTAVAGSGPAYLYYFLEAWKEAAQKFGFSLEESNILISQTLTGSTWLWSDSGNDERALRERVASKGGTTEAALSVLEEGKVAEIFRSAIQRAADRGRELEALAGEKV